MLSRQKFLRSAFYSGAVLVFPNLLQAAATPQAIEGSAAFIKDLATQAIDILRSNSGNIEAREAQFRKLLSAGFDMPFIARFVLGKHWRKATPQQRSDYQALFTEFILQSYSRRMGGYSGETFAVSNAKKAGKKDVLVRTQIKRAGMPPIKADWRVRPKNGQYRIIDIMVEGVSMAVTQRAEFNAVIRQRSIQSLLQILRARTEKFGVTS